MDGSMINYLPTPTEEEEFSLLMSLALDELLDEQEQEAFERYLARYSQLATQWQDWQALHRHITALPHAMPAPDFVGRFEVQLAQQERRRRLRQGFWIGFVTLLLWLGMVGGVLVVGAYLFVNQSALLASVVQNLTYFWAGMAAWLDSLATAANAFAATPQALGLGIGYLVLTLAMLSGWVVYLRRSTQLFEAPAEATAPFSVA
jgi:anti-sigma factor RsiW